MGNHFLNLNKLSQGFIHKIKISKMINMKKIIIILLAISTLITTGFIMTNKQSQIKTSGVHHIGLNVKNLQLSTKFFIETLNFTKVGEKPEYPAIFVSDGTVMVTLWQSNDPDNAVLFDRKNNIGLHHLALSLNNSEDLDTNTSNPKKSS
ncbi:MAG: catechol-2,3-dioxygenase [Lentimonas sp.]|jgi:catechol-2,3-dioxygenase